MGNISVSMYRQVKLNIEIIYNHCSNLKSFKKKVKRFLKCKYTCRQPCEKTAVNYNIVIKINFKFESELMK